jgi:hypothetical protein
MFEFKPFRHPDDDLPENDALNMETTKWTLANLGTIRFGYPSNGKPVVKRTRYLDANEKCFSQSTCWAVAQR